MQRLDRILSEAGVASRKELRAMIRAGRVTVDGAAVTDESRKFDETAVCVTVDGSPVRLRASTDLFRQFCGLKSLKYCAAVGDEGALRMRHAPCGYIQDSCAFQTLA